jgi:general stress protein CsbA
VQHLGAWASLSLFEPLARIVRTGFPYWLIAAVVLSVLTGLLTARVKQAPFLPAAVRQLGATCAFLFIALGLYVQLSGNGMSFLELLPSSFLVATVLFASTLIFAPSKTEFWSAMILVGITFGSVVFGVILAFVLSFFPKLIAVQWHLLKRL